MADILEVVSKVDVQIQAALLGALVGSIGAFMAAYLVFLIQRETDARRIKQEKIETVKPALLQSMRGLHREWVKVAEAGLQLKAAELKAKFLNQENPEGVDKNTSITTADDFKAEALNKRDRIDIHNDRAHEYELKSENYSIELANLVPDYASHNQEAYKKATEFIAQKIILPLRVYNANEADQLDEMVNDQVSQLRTKYAKRYKKLEADIITGLKS